MQKVVLTRGVAASGKSTWAKQQVLDHPGQYVRVNKDSLRYMLYGGKYSQENEQLVLRIRDEIILLALQNGYDVIVDDTNIAARHEQHIRTLVDGLADVHIQDFSHVSLYVCIKRDEQRPAPLEMQQPTGEEMIRKQYAQLQQRGLDR